MSLVQDILHNSDKDTFRGTLEVGVTMTVWLTVSDERKERVILTATQRQVLFQVMREEAAPMAATS